MREGLTFDDVLLIPKKGIISSRKEASLKTKLTRNIEIDIPLVPVAMDTVCESEMAIAFAKKGSIGFIHRYLTIEDQANEVRKVKKLNLRVGAAIGINGDCIERAESLINAGADVLQIDVSHAHSSMSIEVIKEIKRKFRIDLIAGAIASRQAAIDLIKAGVDGLYVGIGLGTICTTRIVTGFGVPQITALMDIYEHTKNTDVPIISTGGITKSGDIVKALAAGADAVVIGSLFAGSDECPGETIEKNGTMYKAYNGMASRNSSSKIYKINNEKDPDEMLHSEGVDAYVKYKGPVAGIIDRLLLGVKSGISYGGGEDIRSLRANAEFIRMTKAGLNESLPHDVEFM